MVRHVIGLDLNGRADFAARDWHLEDPDRRGEIVIIEGGPAGVAVEIGAESSGTWVGGPQAMLAPHGRGTGWGPIGAAGRRRRISEAWDQPEGQNAAKVLAAARDALARGAEQVMVAVPDLPEFDERRRGALIRALSSRHMRVRLVWRSVAAFHGLKALGLIKDLLPGQRVRLLLHGARGLECQTLTLREDPDHKGHSAPLREAPGLLMEAVPGLDAIERALDRQLRAANAHVDWDRCEPPLLAPRLMVGAARPGDSQILRNWNGTWTEVTAPELDAASLGLQDLPPLRNDGIPNILITPLAAGLAELLRRHLSAGGAAIALGPAEVVARGALISARLIERGLPHYFDRLAPIEIAVLRAEDGEPAFAYLVRPDEIVPANQEYRSPDLTGFELRRGQEQVEFYVVKDRHEIRHWTIGLDPSPPAPVPVVLRLRQTPGQSWARLDMTSPQWEPLARNPRHLDWEHLEPIDLTREEVLETLRLPPPPIPERVVEPADIRLWTGGLGKRVSGLSLLEYSMGKDPAALVELWVKALSKPFTEMETRRKLWLVSTDGELPPGLPPEAQRQFDAILEQVAASVVEQARKRLPLHDRKPIRMLTWTFTRCPGEVQDIILDTLEALARDEAWARIQKGRRDFRQAAGRSITGVERLSRLFRYLAREELNNDVLAALHMALSRRREAPEALDRELVDHFLRVLGRELVELIRAGRKEHLFRNTLGAIAGLFRWRHREPRALLAASDPVAAELRTTLLEAREAVEEVIRRKGWAPRHQRAGEIIDAIIAYLDGQGDPDILIRIEEELSEGR